MPGVGAGAPAERSGRGAPPAARSPGSRTAGPPRRPRRRAAARSASTTRSADSARAPGRPRRRQHPGAVHEQRAPVARGSRHVDLGDLPGQLQLARRRAPAPTRARAAPRACAPACPRGSRVEVGARRAAARRRPRRRASGASSTPRRVHLPRHAVPHQQHRHALARCARATPRGQRARDLGARDARVEQQRLARARRGRARAGPRRACRPGDRGHARRVEVVRALDPHVAHHRARARAAGPTARARAPRTSATSAEHAQRAAARPPRRAGAARRRSGAGRVPGSAPSAPALRRAPARAPRSALEHLVAELPHVARAEREHQVAGPRLARRGRRRRARRRPRSSTCRAPCARGALDDRCRASTPGDRRLARRVDVEHPDPVGVAERGAELLARAPRCACSGAAGTAPARARPAPRAAASVAAISVGWWP